MNLYLVEVFSNTDDLLERGHVQANTAKDAIKRVQLALGPQQLPYVYFTACTVKEEVKLYDVLVYVDGKIVDRLQLKGTSVEDANQKAYEIFRTSHYDLTGSRLEFSTQEHYDNG